MRWALAASAVLNSILVITVTGALPFFFFLSLTINIILMWYIFNSFKEYRQLEGDIEDMLVKIFELEEHLVNIHQMEMFYGEPTLQSLIEHTKLVVTDLEEYRQKYSLGGESMFEEEDQEEDQEDL
tara:strand:- start:908 stop:1285 length:378 start_codon:yes stop_codon:yes gene_type:complete